MARRRTFSPNTPVRADVAHLLNQGMTDAQVYLRVKARYPRVNARDLRSEIAKRRGNSTRVQAINKYISGGTRNLRFVEDCPPGSTMSIRFKVQWTDPESGLLKEFGHTVDIRSQKIDTDFLSIGLDAVRRRAANTGYRIPGDQALVKDPDFRITVTGAECR